MRTTKRRSVAIAFAVTMGVIIAACDDQSEQTTPLGPSAVPESGLYPQTTNNIGADPASMEGLGQPGPGTRQGEAPSTIQNTGIPGDRQPGVVEVATLTDADNGFDVYGQLPPGISMQTLEDRLRARNAELEPSSGRAYNAVSRPAKPNMTQADHEWRDVSGTYRAYIRLAWTLNPPSTSNYWLEGRDTGRPARPPGPIAHGGEAVPRVPLVERSEQVSSSRNTTTRVG